MEEFHIPRPKAGEVLIKTKGDYLISWFLIYGIFFYAYTFGFRC
jgi:hypothetical protein